MKNLNARRCLETLFVIVISICSLSAFAGGANGGGGGWREGDLKHYLLKLEAYLSSPEGRAKFLEIVDYDKANPTETFENVLRELDPRITPDIVTDQDGNVRDCYSGFDRVRYFKCNETSLKTLVESAKNESEYYGSLYRLVFHEALVQVHLEKPVSKEVPSEYPIAARLDVHLEYFPEWVPGADDLSKPFDLDGLGSTTDKYKKLLSIMRMGQAPMCTAEVDCKLANETARKYRIPQKYECYVLDPEWYKIGETPEEAAKVSYGGANADDPNFYMKAKQAGTLILSVFWHKDGSISSMSANGYLYGGDFSFTTLNAPGVTYRNATVIPWALYPKKDVQTAPRAAVVQLSSYRELVIAHSAGDKYPTLEYCRATLPQ